MECDVPVPGQGTIHYVCRENEGLERVLFTTFVEKTRGSWPYYSQVPGDSRTSMFRPYFGQTLDMKCDGQSPGHVTLQLAVGPTTVKYLAILVHACFGQTNVLLFKLLVTVCQPEFQ